MKTIKVRAPRDVMDDLRFKFPNVTDANLIRLLYNTSILKIEVGLEKVDFKNKLGRFIYGSVWDKSLSIDHEKIKIKN